MEAGAGEGTAASEIASNSASGLKDPLTVTRPPGIETAAEAVQANRVFSNAGLRPLENEAFYRADKLELVSRLDHSPTLPAGLAWLSFERRT